MRPHRFYKSAQWAALRAQQLAREPFCAFHAKLGQYYVKADTVDHVQPHRGNAELFFNGRLQSLCWSCHSRIKQAIERGKHPGCTLDGRPRSGPWSRKPVGR